MSNASTRLRLIFLPYLLLLLTFPLLYAGVMWLLLYRRPLLDHPMAVAEYIPPLLVGGLVVALALRRRFGLLQDPQSRGVAFSLWVYATLSLYFPSIYAQQLLVSHTRRLLSLPTIGQLPQAPPATYYTLQRYYLDQRRAGQAAVKQVQGKYKDSLVVDLYFSTPILSSAADTGRGRPAAWLGASFHTSLSNRLDSAALRRQYQAFIGRSNREFAQLDLRQFVYLLRVDDGRALAGYRAAVAASPGYQPGPAAPVLRPVDAPFAARGADTGRWLLISAAIGAWVLLAMVQRHPLDPARVAACRARP